MHIDQRQLSDDGYLILRDLIAPEQVAQLRKSIETMIDRRRAISAEHRHAWDISAQPRLQFDKESQMTQMKNKMTPIPVPPPPPEERGRR